MNKKAQMSFSPSDFSQGSQTQEIEKPKNLFERIIEGIIIIVFIVIFSPIIVALTTAVAPNVCTTATSCLFFNFIVPAFILGGIVSVIKNMWSKD
jgi:lipopolysaccharide/colanic/teichoic acid biosynthesis glycosyltransferase